MSMEQQTMARHLVEQLGTALQLPELQLDAEGLCLLSVNEQNVLLSYDEEAAKLQFTAPVGELDDGDYQEFAVKLLQANLVWNDTRGAALALDGDGEVIVFTKWLSLTGMDLLALQQDLEEFINLAISWKNALPGLFAPDLSIESSVAPQDPSMRA